MGKKTYIGVSNVARKVKKAYIGVDGKARKIKKMYIGDANGKARLFFSGGELSYKGTTTALSYATCKFNAGASIGDYALFAGGEGSNTCYKTVDAYNTSLTKSTTNLSAARGYLEGASNSKYAFFAGGKYSSTYFATVDAINESLVRNTSTQLSMNCGPIYHTGIGIGNYALFLGGFDSSYASTLDIFNQSLTYQSVSGYHPYSISSLASTSVGNYALFAGGWYGSSTYICNITKSMSSSLTIGTPTTLSVARYSLAGASVGNYALFAGGLGGTYGQTGYVTVEAYNTSLTRSIPTALSVNRYGHRGASLKGYALFIGGQCKSSTDPLLTVEVYDESLTKHIKTAPAGRFDHAVATVGDYALAAGGTIHSTYDTGQIYTGYATTVDVFVVD